MQMPSTLAAALATALLAPLAAPVIAQANPNVLLVMVDDLTSDYLACYGHAVDPPATPHIDQLASGGVRFDRAYAHPICSPSRTCLQTGRYAFRAGVRTIIRAGEPGLSDEEVLLPEALQGSGHALAMIGKWHLGNRHGDATPNVQGWPHFVGAIDSNVQSYFNWRRVRNGQADTCATYTTTAEVDEALAWTAAQQQPWFLLLSIHAPHTPRHAPPAGLHQQQLAGLDPIADPVPFHKAMIEAVDHELGRLLAGLGPALANTNVILCGDNGTPDEVLPAAANPMRGKGSLYEGGNRIPLIVHGPAVVQGGRTCQELAHLVDLFPTVLSLCGVDPAVSLPGLQLDGVSLSPLLANQPGPVRTSVYNDVFATGFGDGASIIEGGYKLIRFSDGPVNVPILPHEELYDLVADPSETTNLLASPTTQSAAMHSQLLDMLWDMRQLGHVLQFGAGCSGPLGVVRLRTYSPPTIGRQFSVNIPTPALSPAPVLSMQILGFSRELGGGVPLPYDLGAVGMTGCSLLISTDAAHFTGPTGESSYLSIPLIPEFARGFFHLQGFVLDAQANALGMVATAAYRVEMGL